MVNYSVQLHDSKSEGQIGLFEMFEDESQESEQISVSGAPWEQRKFSKLKNNRTWFYEDLLEEKKLLGVFISGHPIDLFVPEQEVFGKIKISDFSNILGKQKPMRGEAGRKKVAVLSFMSAYNQRRTKKGTLMASIRLEQKQDFFEAVMFEKNINENSLPEANTMVVAVGNLDRSFDGENIRFTLEKVVPLQEIRLNRVKSLSLQLNAQENLENIDAIKELILKNIGDTPYSFCLNFARSNVKIDTLDFKLNLSDSFVLALQKNPLVENIHYTI